MTRVEGGDAEWNARSRSRRRSRRSLSRCLADRFLISEAWVGYAVVVAATVGPVLLLFLVLRRYLP